MTLFEIYFLRVTFTDLLDIGLVALLIYTLYRLMRQTIALQVFIGLIALYLIDVIVTAADMTMLRFLFSTVSEVFVIAVIILFQPELRRLLLLLGQTPGLQRFLRGSDQSKVVDEVISATESMAREKMGALMVFTRNTPLGAFIETGTLMQSQISADLIISIFQKNSPLHDGAMIVQAGRIEAVRCILPVTQSRALSPQLGLRHRAAMGLAEQADALVVIVSEETGYVSVAQDGKLTMHISLIELREYLHKTVSPDPKDHTAKPDKMKFDKTRGIGLRSKIMGRKLG